MGQNDMDDEIGMGCDGMGCDRMVWNVMGYSIK